MNSYTLILQDATHNQHIEAVTSFIGEDTSGRFGIMAGHERMITTLVIGLAMFRGANDNWQYLAVPGAVVYFKDNVLILSTRKYLLDSDYTRISQSLQDELLAEEEKLQSMKQSLHRMEEEIYRRMWEMGRPYGV